MSEVVKDWHDGHWAVWYCQGSSSGSGDDALTVYGPMMCAICGALAPKSPSGPESDWHEGGLMKTPTPPCDHTCWQKRPADFSEYETPDIGTERACPACQWQAGYEAGVEWLRAQPHLPLQTITEGVVPLLYDLWRALWRVHCSANGLDIEDKRIRAEEEKMRRILDILTAAQELPHA